MKNTFRTLLLCSLAVPATIASIAPTPAKADLFCWGWESNCKVDGRIGTSGNDILGLPGGDTIQKAAMGADLYLGTGGAITKGVNTYYQPHKRQILDAVGNTIIAPQGQPNQQVQGQYIHPQQHYQSQHLYQNQLDAAHERRRSRHSRRSR